MKKALFLILTAALFISTAQAQKTVIGTVDYSYKIVGEGSENMAGMLPEKMILKYGENGMTIKMQGGMMAAAMGKTVINNETGEIYMIKDDQNTIYIMSDQEIEDAAAEAEEPTIEKLEGSKNILGYKCSKYKQTSMVQGTSISQTIWVTNKLQTPEYNEELFKGLAAQGTMNFGIDGFPMLIEMDMPGMPMTLELEVINIEFEKISKSEFEKPADYATKPFSEMNPF